VLAEGGGLYTESAEQGKKSVNNETSANGPREGDAPAKPA